jgi:hypothetical protein
MSSCHSVALLWLPDGWLKNELAELLLDICSIAYWDIVFGCYDSQRNKQELLNLSYQCKSFTYYESYSVGLKRLSLTRIHLMYVSCHDWHRINGLVQNSLNDKLGLF